MGTKNNKINIDAGSKTGRKKLLLRMALAITIFNVILLILFLSPTHAAFNEMITGARPQGMGGAFTGLADDANTLYWNPAGMTRLKRYEATAMHARKFSLDVGPSLDLDYGAITTGKQTWGALGVSWSREGDKSIISEEILALSYAREIIQGLSLGLSIKSMTLSPNANGVTAQPGVLDQALVDQDTTGFDIGLLYDINNYFSLGVVGSNIGAETGQVIKTELEPGLRVGLAYKPNKKFKIAADVIRRENIKNRQGVSNMLAGGVEYLLSKFLAIRAGLNDDTMTLGLGFLKPDWQMDYAFWNSEIGDTHRISATMRFGNPFTEVAKKVTAKKVTEKKVVAKKVAAKKVSDKKVIENKSTAKTKINKKQIVSQKDEKVSNNYKKALSIFSRFKEPAEKSMVSVVSKEVVSKEVVSKEIVSKSVTPKKLVTKKVAQKKSVKLEQTDTSSFLEKLRTKVQKQKAEVKPEKIPKSGEKVKEAVSFYDKLKSSLKVNRKNENKIDKSVIKKAEKIKSQHEPMSYSEKEQALEKFKNLINKYKNKSKQPEKISKEQVSVKVKKKSENRTIEKKLDAQIEEELDTLMEQSVSNDADTFSTQDISDSKLTEMIEAELSQEAAEFVKEVEGVDTPLVQTENFQKIETELESEYQSQIAQALNELEK